MGSSALSLNRVKRNSSRGLMGRGEDQRVHNKNTRHAFRKINTLFQLSGSGNFEINVGSVPGAFLEVLRGSWPTFVGYVGEPGKPHVASSMTISSCQQIGSSSSSKSFGARPLVGH
ncbi:hypothetical protein TNCV_1903741 [Trichonephila clavipes]|nr:hypothetical protein TNCV_1903741 [Trichonephila clavipes]